VVVSTLAALAASLAASPRSRAAAFRELGGVRKSFFLAMG